MSTEHQPHSDIPARSTRWLVGTAGWIYQDWQTIFYPETRAKSRDPLQWYAQFFDMVEINSTFYHIPGRSIATRWCDKVAANPQFTFALKLWRGFTHRRPARLPEPETHAMQALCRGLQERGRLLALLMQFPWSFRPGRESLDYLETLHQHFAEFPLCLEVRHAAWNTPETFDWLQARGIAFCNVDQPPLRHCLERTSQVTAEPAYLRLHGRNSQNWFAEKGQSHERYDYLYDEEELDAIEKTARTLAAQAGKVAVVGNNHYRGQAPANALELRCRLEEKVLTAPASLLLHYPALQKLPLKTVQPQEQLDLLHGLDFSR